MIPITICPNVKSTPPTRALPPAVDEWQLYSHTLDAYRPPDLPLLIEAGAVKEGDRCDGKAGLSELRRLAESTPAVMVSMDEPLVAGIWPFNDYGTPWPHQAHCKHVEDRTVIFDRIARYVDDARHLGLKVNWYEAWPQHPIDLWLEALAYIGEDCIDRVTIDANPHTGVSVAALHDAIGALRARCCETDTELACVVMGFDDPARETTNDSLFISHAVQHWRWLAQAGPWDRIVVQSWLAHQSVPSTDALIDVATRISWLMERPHDTD